MPSGGKAGICSSEKRKKVYTLPMDIKLNYEERGEGEVLILLHGNGEDHTNFSFQIEYFSRRYRVIAPDTRGHGLSPRGVMPFTISQFADDLRDFMNEMKIEKADILGFSDGGNIALIFALRHPERVHKLILNGANLFPSGCRKDVNRWIEKEYRAAVERGDEYTASLMRLMTDEPDISPGELGALTMPVLVIAGTHDMILRSHTRLIAKSISGSRLVFIPGDHFIAYKNPVEFNRAVEDFLENG